jgi:calcineurin-like phosphoesterase family protein
MINTHKKTGNERMTYFTADTHYGHARVIEYTKRPFKSVEEMNRVMIDNWNSVVRKQDIVYHLGDFSFLPPERSKKIFDQLNGEKHLVLGNHDRNMRGMGWASISDYKEIKVNGQAITLLHYAMRVWNKSHRGAWQLYGHSHNSLEDLDSALQIDVGVDARNFYPISFEEVKAIMSKKKFVPIDHHRET